MERLGCIVAAAGLYTGVNRLWRGTALVVGIDIGVDIVLGSEAEPFEDSVKGGPGHIGLPSRGADIAVGFEHQVLDVAALEALDGVPFRFFVGERPRVPGFEEAEMPMGAVMASVELIEDPKQQGPTLGHRH